jgi:hypothetical protein
MHNIDIFKEPSANVLAYSLAARSGVRIASLEVEFPRIILAEFNTHRMLSRNSASSRAIPFEKMKEQLHGAPVRWGANQAGMQDTGGTHAESVAIPPILRPVFLEFGYDMAYNEGVRVPYGLDYRVSVEHAWLFSKYLSLRVAQGMKDAGYHKQVVNRLLEPYQMMKTVVTATEWGNFFWLRQHGDADPTIKALADAMREAICLEDESVGPVVLEPGQWHLPYVDVCYTSPGGGISYSIKDNDGKTLSLSTSQAQRVSVARCAAVSYRQVGYSQQKCEELWSRMAGGEGPDTRMHGSPFEHQATPMFPSHALRPGEHLTADGWRWSGNLRGWSQLRKTLPHENHVEMAWWKRPPAEK